MKLFVALVAAASMLMGSTSGFAQPQKVAPQRAIPETAPETSGQLCDLGFYAENTSDEAIQKATEKLKALNCQAGDVIWLQADSGPPWNVLPQLICDYRYNEIERTTGIKSFSCIYAGSVRTKR